MCRNRNKAEEWGKGWGTSDTKMKGERGNEEEKGGSQIKRGESAEQNSSSSLSVSVVGELSL